MVAARGDGVQIADAVLAVAVVAAFEYFGESQDRVHRRADLVAHVGQELALEAVRALGFLLRDAQFQLLLL